MDAERVELLLFAKEPVAGFAKTRLAPALGAAGAAALARQMTELCVFRAARFCSEYAVPRDADGGALLRIFCASAAARLSDASDERGSGTDALAAMQRWLGPLIVSGANASFHEQLHSANLGERMAAAFRLAFRLDCVPLASTRAAESERSMAPVGVVIVGCDIPGITRKVLNCAFAALRDADVVLGPAKDGGYYLLGMREFRAELFRDISWSSSTVLGETLLRAKDAKLSVTLLEELEDVDTRESLGAWNEQVALIRAGQEDGPDGLLLVDATDSDERA